MTKSSQARCVSILGVSLLALTLAMPAFAKDKTVAPVAPDTAVAAPVTPAAAPVAAAPVAPKAAPAKAEVATESLTVGDLTFTKASVAFNKDNADILVTIKNAGKVDDRITGAGTTWTSGDIVQITKDKDGKEKEVPVSIDIPAGKSVDLSTDGSFLRIKNIEKPKDASVMPVSFYFRHDANANLNLAAGKGSSGWFSK